VSAQNLQLLNDTYYKSSFGFDQFVLGATLAGCAYLAQTIAYDQLGWNPATVQLVPLLLMALAAYFGFKRIEASIHTVKLNAAYLQLCSQYPGNAFPEQKAYAERASDRSGGYYSLRNLLLMLSLMGFVAAKILVKYDIF